MRIGNWLSDQSRRVRRSMSVAVGLGLASGLLLVVQAWLLVQVADGVVFGGKGISELLPVLAAMVAVFLARALGAWGSERAGFASASVVKIAVRDQLFRNVQELGPVFLRGKSSGEIATVVTDAVEALEPYYARYLPQRAIAVFVPLAILAFIYPLDLFSGALLSACALAVPVLMIVIGQGAEALNRRQWSVLSRMSARFLDTLQGLTTLKLFGASRREALLVAEVSDEFRKGSMAVMRIAFLSALMLELFSTVSIAAVAISIGLRLMDGRMQLRAGYFILLLAPELFLPLRSLGLAYHARMGAIAAAERIVALLDAPAPRRRRASLPAGRPAAIADGGISIAVDDLHFAYDDGPRTLLGVSFRLEPGTRVALVGPSGAGKSTLVNLLIGFLEPASGSIRANGVDLGEIPIGEWHRRVTWMPQNPRVFHGTILDNIRLGQPEAHLDRVIDAASRARAHDFIHALPAGYDTLVGDSGAGLSGGQVQRIALARAFLKDAPVILLDEAGAHMDSESERLVRAGIEELARGRTLLTVAHRLSTVENADEILVLDKGRIVERGTHGELAGRDGLYARMAAASRGAA